MPIFFTLKSDFFPPRHRGKYAPGPVGVQSNSRKRNENNIIVIYREDPDESGVMSWTESLSCIFSHLCLSSYCLMSSYLHWWQTVKMFDLSLCNLLAHVHFTVCLNTERVGSGEEGWYSFPDGSWTCSGWRNRMELWQRLSCGLWADWKTSGKYGLFGKDTKLTFAGGGRRKTPKRTVSQSR